MTHQRSSEKGNILFLILIAVVLFAALSYVISKPDGSSASSSNATRISEDIKSQASMIRSSILECNLVYNYGYPTAAAYPANLEDVMCQTDNNTPTPTTQAVFGGASGRFVPLPPKPFSNPWQYNIDTGTTPHTITVTLSRAMDCSGDQAMKSAMTDILPSQFATGEVTTVCNGTTASFTLNIVKGT